MQKSKSLLSFGPSNKKSEVGQEPRSRRRSSLDTFVIPGRTRLPSSKSSADATDILIAQQLLNHSTMQNPNIADRPTSAWLDAAQRLQEHSPTPRSGSGRHRISPQKKLQRTPRLGSKEVISLGPHRRPRQCMPRSQSHVLFATATEDPIHGITYDGTNEVSGSGHASRMSSMTWSTVSHRVFSNSSESSRGSRASEFMVEYNDLAEKHGLPQLTGENSEEEESNASQTRITQKSHHGWLARKIFRRSSTYTLKAKTTYKPISKKKSLGGIRLLSEDGPTNILTGRTLEEICRLGGLGTLELPLEHAVDKLTLPVCLSATATYLLDLGCNSPGIFRVSGTTSIVNQLYNHYDHQFADAGSPSKVEETVGPGGLPTQTEFLLPDIASLFKKIIIGLPGGLLGSLELFDALRGILSDWTAESPPPETAHLRTRMIALATCSVRSRHRMHLIEAVLGLVSYFGAEAEKAQIADKAAAEVEDRPDPPRSELMGFQSLGVVLGPLLLGDLTDSIDLSSNDGGDINDSTSAPPELAELLQENKAKPKKQKRKSIANKLGKNADLTAQVDRANLTAKVMHLLLVYWKEVVTQLRDIKDTSNLVLPIRKSTNQVRKMPSRAASKHTLKSSEEELQFLDILRGRTLPEELMGDVRMTRKLKMKSRSPMSRDAVKISEDDGASQPSPPLHSQTKNVKIRDNGSIAESSAHNGPAASTEEPLIPNHAQIPFTEDIPSLDPEQRTNSDLAMDRMAMGTILPRPGDSSIPLDQISPPRHVTPEETPGRREHSRSSSDGRYVPETAVRIKPRLDQRKSSIRLVGQPSLDKPLPPIGTQEDASPSQSAMDDPNKVLHDRKMSSSRSHRSRRSTGSSPYPTRQSTPRRLVSSRGSSSWDPPPPEDGAYPPRQSSLAAPGERRNPEKAIDPIPTFDNLTDYKAWSQPNAASPSRHSTPRRTNDALHERTEAGSRGDRNSNGSVKMLAQKFAEASRAYRNEEQARQATKDEGLTTIYAYVRPLSSRRSSDDDPFVSTPNHSPERETLIPKPVHNIGHSRRVESPRSASRTPSPRKRVNTQDSKQQLGQRGSLYNIMPHQNTQMVDSNIRSNTHAFPPTPTPDIKPDSLLEDPKELRGSKVSSPNLNTSGSYIVRSKFSKRPQSNDRPVSPHHRWAVERRDEEGASSETPSLTVKPLDTHPATRQSPTPGSSGRTDTYRNASDALKKLERHGSVNANTMLFQEVQRLQRQLEQKGEEAQAARRSLDIVRETSKEPYEVRSRQRRSWSKDMAFGEAEREKEVSFWRARAEEAERKLAEKEADRQGVNVEVILETDRGRENRSGGIYVDNGWGGSDVAGKETAHMRGGQLELSEREWTTWMKRPL